MRLVFMGTPDFAVPPLRALHAAGHDIAAVLAQPDRISGRGKKLQAPPVKQAALELGLSVFQPESVNSAEALAFLRELAPELLAVVAYGQFLGDELLALPPLGAVNIHASLLPAYRGAAPIHRAVLNGESISGVTIMYIDSGMDSGDIILQKTAAIGPDMTSGELHDILSGDGAELLLTALRHIERGDAPRVKQDHDRATRAPMLKPEEEKQDWSLPAQAAHDHIRGLSPWPGAYTMLRGMRLKLLGSTLDFTLTRPMAEDTPPGTVLRADERGIVVACGQGALMLLRVQPAGKSPMSAGELIRGRRVEAGEILG